MTFGSSNAHFNGHLEYVSNNGSIPPELERTSVLFSLIRLIVLLPLTYFLLDLLRSEALRSRLSSFQVWLILLAAIFFLTWALSSLVLTSLSLTVRSFIQEFYRPPEEVDIRRLTAYRSDSIQDPFFWPDGYLIAKEGGLYAPEEWQIWMAENLGGPLRLIVFDGWAVYVECGNRFSRIVGPGSSFLGLHETVKEVVDLRPQIREGVLQNCWTQDGIKVNVHVRLECCIGNPNGRQEGQVYPFDPLAVKKAVERTSARMPDGRNLIEMKGVELVWGQITGIVPAYIGQRTLDDLMLSERDSGPILSAQARQELLEAINQNTQQFGYHVTDFQITRVEVPEVVEAQRTLNWQAEKQRMEMLLKGQSEAARIRALEEARASAQRDLILAIAEGLNKDPSRQFTEPLLVALANTLNVGLSNPLVRPMLADETLEVLERLRQLLEGKL